MEMENFEISPKKKEEEINSITKEILNTDFSKINVTETMDFLYNILNENRPVMYEKEIESLYNKYIEQSKDSNYPNRLSFEIGRSIMNYTSDTKVINKETKENTLDRSYKIFYEIAEKNPEEMHNLSEWTHHLFEFVKPEVFFDTYIKIMNSDILNKYFGGSQFSQLEYNMSYCGTDKYVSALLKKIDFKNSSSCLKSSQLINLAASLAYYSKNGSYSGTYDVDQEIIKGLKPEINNPESIYLLGSKTRYIISRLENGYFPFIHQRSIFKIAPNKFACMKNGELYILGKINDQLNNKVDKYIEIDNQINTPPQEIIDEAIRLERDYVDWEPDRSLTTLRERMKEELFSSMSPVSENDLSLSLKNVQKSQLLEYTNLVGTDYRNFLGEEFNFDFSEISIPEQFYFLEFLQKQNNSSILPIKEFTNKYKKDGMRTFLSIEQGGREMGDKILTLGEKLPEEVAEKVFVKYGEIINAADRAEEEVRKIYEKDNIPGEVFQSIKEVLLRRGASLLSGLADRLNDNNKINEEDVFNTLEDIKTSTIIMGESYVELYKQGIKVPIEEIKDTTLEKIEANNLSEKEKQELVKVYENGRPKETYENKEHLKLLTEEFKQTLENKDTFVFSIRLGGEMIAFATFYKENEDTLHIGGLTFIDDVRNPVVGEAVMNSIMKEFSSFNIKALVHSENKILKMYQKRFGFKIIKELPREENAGELYYEIERMKDGGEDLIRENIAA